MRLPTVSNPPVLFNSIPDSSLEDCNLTVEIDRLANLKRERLAARIGLYDFSFVVYPSTF